MEVLRYNLSWAWTRATVAMASALDDTPRPARSLDSIPSDDQVRQGPALPIEQFDVAEPLAPSVPSNAAEDETRYPTGWTSWLTFATIAFSLVLTGLDSEIVATAVPAITDEFGTISDVGWYSTGFRLTMCSFQFMFGRIYQVWSIKRVFLTSMVIFELGALICGVSPSSKTLILGRAVQGMGCAGLTAGCYAMLTVSFPLRRRPMFTGAGGSCEVLSAAFAPLIGGVLTTRLSWRWCFYINLPLGAIAFLLTLFIYKDLTPSRHQHLPLLEKIAKLDLFGTLIFVPAIVALLIALQYGGTVFGWTDPRIMTCFSLSVLLIGLFILWQIHRGDNATLPPRIIKQRNIIAGMIFSGCNNGSINIIQYYTVMQLSAQSSGLLSLPFILSFMISVLSGGALTSALGYYTVPMVFTSLVAPVACGMLSTLSVDPASSQIVGYQLLLGFASGLGFQGPQMAAQTLMDPADISFGIACIQFSQSFFPALLIPAAQTLFTDLLNRDLALFAPGVDVGMGLSDLRSHVQTSQLNGTLQGLDKSLMQTFYLPTSIACFTVVGTLGIEWKNIKTINGHR